MLCPERFRKSKRHPRIIVTFDSFPNRSVFFVEISSAHRWNKSVTGAQCQLLDNDVNYRDAFVRLRRGDLTVASVPRTWLGAVEH